MNHDGYPIAASCLRAEAYDSVPERSLSPGGFDLARKSPTMQRIALIAQTFKRHLDAIRRPPALASLESGVRVVG